MFKNLRSLITTVFILCFINSGFAQEEGCSCTSDIELLHKKVKKTPSYKRNKKVYKELYLKSSQEAKKLESGYHCFILMNKLLLALNDNHCHIYGTDKGAKAEIRKDAAKMEEFKKSALYKSYPKLKLNLDSLKKVLSSKNLQEIEGLYFKKGFLDLGVYKSGKEYKAIVLKSEKEIWQPGEIVYHLVPYGNNYVLNIGGDISSKWLMSYPERIENGYFLTMGFQKDPTKTNYSVSLYRDSTYVRREISAETTYIKIGSFNSWYPTLSDAESFYKSLEGTLTKKNLIIDLRDNGGGGNRNSNVLLEIIEDYIKENKVSVITNNRTASNAEQFAFKLKQFENCKTYGHRTNGTAAYELVNANYNLPCGNFIAVLTSKKHKEFLGIESIGLEPDQKLSMDIDWIEQLINITENNH